MNPLCSNPLIYLVLASCASQPPQYQSRLSTWKQMRDDVQQQSSKDFGPITEKTSLPELLSYARANNPGLKAAFERWKQSLERIPQVTTLPNPRLSLGAYLSEVETRVGPTQARVGVAQPFPWFGKLELAGGIAFEASEAARERLEAFRLDLDERVRSTWYEYAWVEQAIIITQGNRDLLTHWESVARSRMEAGLGRYADVIRAQVELGKLEDRVQTLKDLRRPLVAKLNAALNRDSNAELPKPSLSQTDPPPLDEKQLLDALPNSSPVLRALQHQVQGAETGIELADKAFYPDFTVGADYTVVGSAVDPSLAGSGDDAMALTLGLELPIWRESYRAGSREAEARRRGTRMELAETQNRLAADLEMSLYTFRDADRRLKLFQDSLVPKGEESIQSLDIAYQSGDEGFLDLIDAQRVLLEFQLQAARAAADRATALATTERITGIQLIQER